MNNLLEKTNHFIANHAGFLPLLGIGLAILDLLLQIFPGPDSSWFVNSNLLLHIGVIVGLLGILLARALEGS